MNNKIAPTGSAYRAVLALALASSCAYAQYDHTTPAAAEETELAPVTVSAYEGSAIPYDRTGVSVTVLDTNELKKEGIYSLSEALETVPGLYVQPGGGSNQKGNLSTPSVRGMSADRFIAPMMDGMLLGSGLSSDGLIAGNVVARTPIFGVGTLEMLRGAQGAVYGSGAMSGVLYMETPEGKGDPSISLFNEAGSFDSYTGNVTAQGESGKSAFFVSATYDRTNNDIRYADGSRPTIKHAGRFENWSEAIRLDHHINERNTLTFTYRRDDSTYRYFYPAIWGDATCSQYEYSSNLLTLKYKSKVTDKFNTAFMVGYYDHDAIYGAHGSYPYGATYMDLYNVQVDWRNSYRWNEANETTAGVAWRRTDFKNKGASVDTKVWDSILSLFAEHSVEPVKNWTSTLALRLDESNVYDALFTVRASTNYKFNGERTRVFASAGRGYAAPSSLERSNSVYDYYGSPYYGNPDLECETNWSVDLGAEQQVSKDHYLSATLFWIRTKDAITTTGDYISGYHWVNAGGHWTNQGVELAMRGTFEKNWNTGYKLAFTYAQPKDSSDMQLPSSARQVWTADVHTSPVKGLTTGVGLAAAVGRVGFNSYAGTQRIDNYVVLRWYAQYEVNENLSIHVRVENLTNEKFETESTYGSPAASMVSPGAAVYAGCTLKF